MAVPKSGQTTVASAGTAEQLAVDVEGFTFLVAALPTNTGVVYVGNDGSDDVSSSNGYAMSAGDPPVEVNARNANEIWVDVDSNGEGVSWMRVQ